MENIDMQFIASQLRKPSGDYAQEIASRMNESNEFMNVLTIQELNIESGDYICEIGMGNGHFVPNIIEVANDVSYIGCDYSEEMVATANEKNQEQVNMARVVFHHASVQNLPIESERVDKLFSINTLYFWEDYTAAFQEIHRVLKPKGKITLSIRPKDIMEKYPFIDKSFKTFSQSDVRELLEQNNFEFQRSVRQIEAPRNIAGKMYNIETLIVTGIKA